MTLRLLKDPLQEIFEQHLFKSSAEELASPKFVQNVIDEYLHFLALQGVHVPGPARKVLLDDLREEVREMVIRQRLQTGFLHEPGPSPSQNKRITKKVV